MIEPVSERDLLLVLKWMEGFRKWSIRNNIDPWAVRQGLIILLEMDTYSMLDHGISLEALKEFDRKASHDAKMWIVKAGKPPREIIEQLKKELGI